MSDSALPSLEPADLTEFLKEVHGFDEPFPWHIRLLGEVIGKGWPPAIAVPTGLGKTCILDVAIFALALQAHLPPGERTARTRTFFIIDRRLVVDDVTAHAECIREALSGPGDKRPTARSVAERLHAIGHRKIGDVVEPTCASKEEPLTVTKMRGGTSWAARWIRRPEQPAIVVGTVDQIGSRALFRGYGVTPGARPIDAALVGADSLIILDEAHLAEPLRTTLTHLQAWEASVGQPVLPRRSARFVTMSATSRTKESPFTLDVRDRTHLETRKRLTAAKNVSLWNVGELVPKRDGPTPNGRLALAGILARAAVRLADNDQTHVVGIIANTVAAARMVYEKLEGEGHRTELLIGRVRDVDRDILVENLLPKIKAGRETHATDHQRPLFVVATQTIEVGVNLDFDALVSEAAPIDALAQRLGRLDRLGRRTEQKLRNRAILVFAEVLHAEDPIYGEATFKTWKVLTQRCQPAKATKDNGPDALPIDSDFDLSPQALSELLASADPSEFFGPKPRVPSVLPRSMLHGWAQTSPVPRSDMDIEPFLHGDQPLLPTVNVIWRADLAPDRFRESVEESLAARPAQAQEQLEVPIYHLRQFLAREYEAAVGVADTPHIGGNPSGGGDTAGGAGRVTSSGKVSYLQSAADLQPGDIVVLRGDRGGLDRYGWNPACREPVVDVADLCRSRAGLRLRIDPRTLAPLSPQAADVAEAWLAERRRLGEIEESDRPDPKTLAKALKAAFLLDITANGSVPYRDKLDGFLEEMTDGRTLRLIRVTKDRQKQRFAEVRWVLAAPPSLGNVQAAVLNDEFFEDEDDTVSLTGQVTLDQHSGAVAAQARASATRLGLEKRLVDALALAALVHDIGKADPRFQRMLRRGGEWSYLPGDEPLAKSGMDPADKAAWRRAREHSGWPSGLRHEALSVALFDARFGRETELDGVDLELVRYLVGTHHGWNRPLFEPVTRAAYVPLMASVCGQEVQVAPDVLCDYALDWGAPRRMAQVIARYGAWGVALLETVLRLSDQTCSEAGS